MVFYNDFLKSYYEVIYYKYMSIVIRITIKKYIFLNTQKLI